MKLSLILSILAFMASAHAQIQVELKLKRLQYIAHEAVVATFAITNLAGRDVDLRNDAGQRWFGFELTGSEGQPLPPLKIDSLEPSLRVEAGKTVTRKVNLTAAYPVTDLGTYRVRANVFFADLNKYFYSQTKVFQVTDARPIWQKTVGVPDGAGPGAVRTYSLLSNRFPNHTSLYVRVEDKNTGVVYATYSVGRVIAFDEPTAEIDQQNTLHILHCSAPRTWAYSHVGLNGEMLKQTAFLETKTRPRLRHTVDGTVAVQGGIAESAVAAAAGKNAAPKLSTRPANIPKEEE